jgi:hypothetical protein
MRSAGEGSASDEPERCEEERSDDEGAMVTGEGSASDEPERCEEERSDDEGAIITGRCLRG